MTDKTHTTATKAGYTGVIPNKPLGFLWFTTKPFWFWLIVGTVFSASTQVLNTYTAVFIGSFADAASVGLSPDQFARWSIYFTLLLLVTFIAFRLGGFVSIRLVLRQHTRALEEVKTQLFQHSHQYFIDRFAGSLTSKVFNAGDRSSELLLMGYYGFVRMIVSFVATGVVIYLADVRLAFAYVLVLLVTVLVNIYLVKRRRPFVVDYAKATSGYRGQITDVISNVQAVRQYARLGFEYNKLNNTLTDRVNKDRRQWIAAEWNHTINNFMALILIVVMVGGIYWLLVNDLSTAGAMVTVMILMYRVSGIILDLGDWMNRFIRIYGEVEEGLSEIFVDHEINNLPGATQLQVEEGGIVWSQVNFEYGENKVFDSFNLKIHAGERVGLVGPSGAGKTTFVSLLLRQHDIQSGSIKIDGQNIAEVTQDSLRENIAVVPQEPLLFHRSIRENIAYGKPEVTEEEIIEVAKKAQAHDFISQLPEGYDTLVGERGVKLSGGQKQRVAIARAMLKDAPILVLDEATSALDSESEVEIQKALHILMEGKTVVAIAHRLSTLREMDRIIVLENGQIVEDGTHDTLTKAGGTYARLWEHQAGGFLQE